MINYELHWHIRIHLKLRIVLDDLSKKGFKFCEISDCREYVYTFEL